MECLGLVLAETVAESETQKQSSYDVFTAAQINQ